MTRLIDANALKENIRKNYVICTVGHYFDDLFQDFYNAIDEQPTIDAEPVKRGEWRQTYLDHEAFGERPSIFYCSACCACSNVKTNYCPNCGARMDKDD